MVPSYIRYSSIQPVSQEPKIQEKKTTPTRMHSFILQSSKAHILFF